MKEIKLTQGKVALVDDEDFGELNKYRWCIMHTQYNTYAYRNIRINKKQITILMHRQIMNATKTIEVDHIDYNGLNNQKTNLRNVTSSKNKQHRRIQSNNTSGYIGVYWSNQKGRWIAQRKINKKNYYGGSFVDKEKAGYASDLLATRLHGEYATVNFPKLSA